MDLAPAAADADARALEALGQFFDEVIALRDEFVLPLHGGPVFFFAAPVCSDAKAAFNLVGVLSALDDGANQFRWTSLHFRT